MTLPRAFAATVFVAALLLAAPLSAQTEQRSLSELQERFETVLEALADRPARQREVLDTVGAELEDAALVPERIDEMIVLLNGVIADFEDGAEVSTALNDLRAANLDWLAVLRSRDAPNANLIAQLEDNIAGLDEDDIERARIVTQARNTLRDLERHRQEITDTLVVASLTEATELLRGYVAEVGIVVDDAADFINDGKDNTDAQQDSP